MGHRPNESVRGSESTNLRTYGDIGAHWFLLPRSGGANGRGVAGGVGASAINNAALASSARRSMKTVTRIGKGRLHTPLTYNLVVFGRFSIATYYWKSTYLRI